MNAAEQLREGGYFFVVAWIMLLTVPTFIFSIVNLKKFREHEFILVRNPTGMKISLFMGAVSSFIVAPGGGYIFIRHELEETPIQIFSVITLAISMNLVLVVVLFRMIDVFNKIKRARMFIDRSETNK